MVHPLRFRTSSLLLLLLVLTLAPTARATAQSRSLALPEGHEFTSPDHMPFALSADGTRMTYVARAMLYVQDLKGGSPSVVRGPVEARGKANPIFTLDGQSIVYWAQDDSVLERVPANGGTPARLGRVAEPLGMSWAPDGRLFIGQGPQGIVRMPAGAGPVETVVRIGANETAIAPQLLPDGDHLLFTLGQGTPRVWSVVIQSLRTGARTTVTAGSNATYLRGGRLVYLQGARLVVDRFDEVALTVAGQPRTLAPDVAVATATGAAQLALSPNGVLVVAGTAAAPVRMALVALDGHRTVLGEVLADTNAPRVSVDGKQVAFAVAPAGSRGRDIYIADVADVTHPRKVISNGTFPVFSPDGQWLAFGSLNTLREGGEEALFMQRA
ncbi:MAG: hypothetical protein ABL982_21695, partial [Vicinamibacterales bacterium]